MDNSTKISEQDLVKSLKMGSVGAFNMIYELYAKKLITYIARATKNKEDAEEIVHDIFLSLWKKHKELEVETNLATYLFSIAYLRRIDFFRHSLTAPIYEDYMLSQNKLVSEENCQLEYSEFCNVFNQALCSIPPKLKTLLIQSRIKGLSNEQIAANLNISQKTVRNGISMGLKLLKEQLNILGYNLNI